MQGPVEGERPARGAPIAILDESASTTFFSPAAHPTFSS